MPSRVPTRHGIPVTDPVQTLIDLATELKPLRLERAVNEADKLDLVDPETLRRALDGYVGDARGEEAARRCSTATPSGSPTPTSRFSSGPSRRARGFPLPLTKHWVLGYEVDFFFPDHDLIVETDGLATTARPPNRPGPRNETRPTPPPASGSSASPTGRSPTPPTR